MVCKLFINIYIFNAFLLYDKAIRIKCVTYSPIHYINDANDVLWGASGVSIIIRNENNVEISII